MAGNTVSSHDDSSTERLGAAMCLIPLVLALIGFPGLPLEMQWQLEKRKAWALP